MLRTAKTFVAAVNGASRAFCVAAIALLIAAVLVVCQMVFIRYALNGSTVWQTEFAIYSITSATFMSAPYVLMTRGHVRMDLLISRAGLKSRRVMEVTAGLASVFFLGLLAWSSGIHLLDAWRGGWSTETAWELPLWIPLLPLPSSMGLLCLQYVAILMDKDMEAKQ